MCFSSRLVYNFVFSIFSFIHLSSFRYFKATFLSFCRLRYNVRMTNLKITQISQCCQHQVWRLIVWETYMNNRRQTPNKDESSFSTLSTIALDLIVETFVFTMVYSVPDYDKIDSLLKLINHKWWILCKIGVMLRA